MNSAKTLLVVGVLSAVGIAAYLVLSSGPPPEMPEAARNWEEDKLRIDNVGQRSQVPGSTSYDASTGDVDGSRPAGGDAPPFQGGTGFQDGTGFQGGTGDVARAPRPRFDPNESLGSSGSSPDRRFGGTGSFPSPGGTSSHAGHDHHHAGTGEAAKFPPARPGAPNVSIPGIGASAHKFGSPLNAAPKDPVQGSPYSAKTSTDRFALGGTPSTSPSIFNGVMAKARGQIAENKLAEALSGLTPYYDDPSMSKTQQEQINDLLDQLAGTVIYSRDNHQIEPPYEVRTGERLQTIAQQYKVPWQLLAKINRIADPDRLPAGTRLKVVRGPFKAILNVDQNELTLMANDRYYAGRFPLEIKGATPPVQTYIIREKNRAQSPWLELSNRFLICGPGGERSRSLSITNGGCAVLSEQDVDDVYDILEVAGEVRVKIRR